MPRLVTRDGKDTAIEDGVLVWVSGKEAGIYRIAEMIAQPEKLDNIRDRNDWIAQTPLGIKP